MNYKEAIIEVMTLVYEWGPYETLERLRGAGSGPESCCRSRVAVEGARRPLATGSETPLPDQATGAKWEPASSPPDDEIMVIGADFEGEVFACYHLAGFWRYMGGEIASPGVTHWMHFPEAPRAQSDSEEVEECPHCDAGEPVHIGHGVMRCDACNGFWARRKRTERSGSGNDHGMARRPNNGGKPATPTDPES